MSWNLLLKIICIDLGLVLLALGWRFLDDRFYHHIVRYRNTFVSKFSPNPEIRVGGKVFGYLCIIVGSVFVFFIFVI